MLCAKCNSILKKYGFNSNGIQKFKCAYCRKFYLAHQDRIFDSMRVSESKGLSCIELLLEGISVRSTERILNVHRDTILDLLNIAGRKCILVFDKYISKIPVNIVQADEIWSFIFCKERHKNIVYQDNNRVGDAYIFVAIESQMKLILSWHLGRRTNDDTEIFINKLDRATDGRFQLTTDGFEPYKKSVISTLGTRVDFAQIIKSYKYQNYPNRRYSPSKLFISNIVPVIGKPNYKYISTSHVERQNLTMRMQIRRLTRLTNGFSKKWENHKAALALYFAHYNFCRVHSSIKCTPAMRAGITNHVWTLKELLM